MQKLELAESALWTVGYWGNVFLSPEPQQLLPHTGSVGVHSCVLASSPKERQTLSPPEAPTAVLVTVKLSQAPIYPETWEYEYAGRCS